MSGGERFEIIDADYRRNGVSGVGFYVGLVKDVECGDTKLVISFDMNESADPGYCAVLNVDEAAAGNIRMHPGERENGERVRGGNAWRGDRYQYALHDRLRAVALENYDRGRVEWFSRPE